MPVVRPLHSACGGLLIMPVSAFARMISRRSVLYWLRWLRIRRMLTNVDHLAISAIGTTQQCLATYMLRGRIAFLGAAHGGKPYRPRRALQAHTAFSTTAFPAVRTQRH